MKKAKTNKAEKEERKARIVSAVKEFFDKSEMTKKTKERAKETMLF